MNSPIPLWRLLQAASQIVAEVRAGKSTSQAVPRVDATLRAGAQALAFHALRELGRAQALRAKLASRAPAPGVDALLCTALALCWREEHAPYPPFTLVDQAVEAAKRDDAMRAQANFVNACLRRFLRERDALVAATEGDEVARWNHPQWWIARLRRDYPDAWQQILEADNRRAPMTLRVNARHGERDAYLARLQAEGVTAVPSGWQGVILSQPRDVHQLPGFDDGVVSVQDAGAQLAAPLLLEGFDLAKRLRILDACAAPGGKTAHILELADAELVALDISPQRCERIRENLAREHLAANVIAADALQPKTWWDGRPFDAILLDAPCTASGIVRRHPDVRWLRRETDVAQLAQIQARLLSALWPVLREGGRLVYCTCSVFRDEGERQVQTFLAHNKEAVLRSAPGHLLPHSGEMAPGVGDNLLRDHDGFFYAVLDKLSRA
ncbi:MAG TPA: 16S rRNA (cytosine(967)-C(5))-methyltransferase RsmB [Ramlibacter sp.]|nr:16S rRNA (cytosine(967)-C(5))-methyltransferase RsmB [Ramlibacter sp.]